MAKYRGSAVLAAVWLVGTAWTSSATERKSIAYLGIGYHEQLAIPDHHMAAIEKNLRAHLELPRFDTIEIAKQRLVSVEQFIQAYQAVLREGAGEAAPAWAGEVGRLRSSAFFYQITVTGYSVSVVEHALESDDVLVFLDAQVDFFRLDLSDPAGPSYLLEATVRGNPPARHQEPLSSFGPLEPQLDEAVARAAAALGATLALEMRRLPAFQLRLSIAEVLPDGVRLASGEDLGLDINMGFDVMRATADGARERVGYVKIREVGQDGSTAENIAVGDGWSFQGDEELVEHPMRGFGFEVGGVAELSFGDLLGDGFSSRIYPGIDLWAEVDLSKYVGWPEFFLFAGTDILFIGPQAETDVFFTLVHASIGVKKKFFVHRLGISVGLRGGICYYIFSDDRYADESHLGVGADAFVGLEYFVVPEFSFYARMTGRVFTNPLRDFLPEAENELAILANLGASVSF